MRMNLSLSGRYEQTISILFSSFSVILFLLLILLIVNPSLITSSVILPVILISLSLLVIRSFLKEHKEEVFNISSPTIFESGLLVFQSPMNRCAIFFSYNITPTNFQKTVLQKTLTIIFKILPVSSTIALEWKRQGSCFISFYIRLEKSSFLIQARELLDTTSRSLENALGVQNVRLLNGDELMNHFSLGIPGRFKKLSIGRKNEIHICTDETKTKRVIATVSAKNSVPLASVLSQIELYQNAHIILPIKKHKNATEIAQSFILVFSNSAIYDSVRTQQSTLIALNSVPAPKSLRCFGDLLSRNQIKEPSIDSTFGETSEFIIKMLSTRWPSRKDPNSIPAGNQRSKEDLVDSRAWREIIFEQLIELRIKYSKDSLLFVDKLPMRVDAQTDNLLIFVIPPSIEQHLQWFLKKITTLLEKESSIRVILLFHSMKYAISAQSKLSSISEINRISFVSNKEKFVLLLKRYGQEQQNPETKVPQVA